MEKNKSATFVAELKQGQKAGEFTWMKDGHVLKEIPMKIKFTINKNQLGLDIMDCSMADSGQYALIATNDQGENKAAFSLNVYNASWNIYPFNLYNVYYVSTLKTIEPNHGTVGALRTQVRVKGKSERLENYWLTPEHRFSERLVQRLDRDICDLLII